MKNIIKRNPGEYSPFITRRIAHERINRQMWYERIINLFENYPKKGFTAHEIATLLFYQKLSPDCARQTVAPRLTELSQKGILETGDIKVEDSYSGKLVSIYYLTKNYKKYLHLVLRKRGENDESKK